MKKINSKTGKNILILNFMIVFNFFLQIESFKNQVNLTIKGTEVDIFLLIIKKLIFSRCHRSYIIYKKFKKYIFLS